MKDLKLRPLTLDDFFKDEATSFLLPLHPPSMVNEAEEFHDAPDPDSDSS